MYARGRRLAGNIFNGERERESPIYTYTYNGPRINNIAVCVYICSRHPRLWNYRDGDDDDDDDGVLRV